jgi:hypothetical protein
MKPFGMGHLYIYHFLLRMTDAMTSQNIDLRSWDTLYRIKLSKNTHVIILDQQALVFHEVLPA